MPEAISLREIGPEYGEEMLRIVRAAPMTARDMMLCVDRRPSPFRMSELQFDRYHYAGFFLGVELLGFTVFGVKTLYVGGQPEPVFTQTDFYFHPRLQGLGLSRNLWYRSFSFFAERAAPGCSIGYNVILKGNRRAASTVAKHAAESPHPPCSRQAADFTIHILLAAFARRRRNPYAVRGASRADIPAVVRLLDEEFRKRLFGPVLTTASFGRLIEGRPDFGIDNILTAWSGSELVGVCTLWDPSAFKQSLVIRYRPRMRAVSWGYRLAGGAFGFPPLPKPGGRFRELDVAEYAVRERDPAIMAALLARARALANERRYHFVAFGSSSDDVLLQAAHGPGIEIVRSTITLTCLDADALGRAVSNARLPFLNVALL